MIQSTAHALPLINLLHRFQYRMKNRMLRKVNLSKVTQLGSDRHWKFSNLGIFALKTTEESLPHEAPEALSCLV